MFGVGAANFYLYNRQGERAVHYGGDDVQFDPGSCCVQVLDRDTLEARPSDTHDLVRIVQVAEIRCIRADEGGGVRDRRGNWGSLPALRRVTTSNKPVLTGSFSTEDCRG